MKICPHCGAKLSANTKFCSHCGTDVRNVKAVKKQGPVKTRLKKRWSRKYLITGLAVILILVAVIIFGVYKYRTSPAHNPNNPLANQTMTFKKYKQDDGGTIVWLSQKNLIAINRNLFLIALRKSDPNSPAAKYFIAHPAIEKDIYYDHETAEIDKLATLSRHDSRFCKVWWDIINHYRGHLHLSPHKNLHNGEQVKISIPADAVTRKYGVDTTPRVVKVTKVEN